MIILQFANKSPAQIMSTPIAKAMANLLSIEEEIITIEAEAGSVRRRLLASFTLVNMQVEEATSELAILLKIKVNQVIANGELTRAMQAIGLPAPTVIEQLGVTNSVTPAPTTASAAPASEQSGLSAGVLTGIVVGSVVGGLLIFGGIVFWFVAIKKCTKDVSVSSAAQPTLVSQVVIESQPNAANINVVYGQEPQYIPAASAPPMSPSRSTASKSAI
jgi:hypothetical protein